MMMTFPHQLLLAAATPRVKKLHRRVNVLQQWDNRLSCTNRNQCCGLLVSSRILFQLQDQWLHLFNRQRNQQGDRQYPNSLFQGVNRNESFAVAHLNIFLIFLCCFVSCLILVCLKCMEFPTSLILNQVLVTC